MAELSGVFAVSHTPVLTNAPDAPDADVSASVFSTFKRLGEDITALQPDALIVVSDDHLHNFFLNNMPAFCLGVADQYDSPLEGWLKVERRMMRGHPALSEHLMDQLFDAGFDPAFSMDLTLDHGIVTPLECAGLAGQIPIVPLYVNCVQPPLPRMARCIQLGKALRMAIQSSGSLDRVVVLATGGLSHDVGTPRMGIVNEDFDRNFLRLLTQGGDPNELVEFAQSQVQTAGNGAEEVRNWLIAHGVADCRPFRLAHYHPVESWYTGIGLGSWGLA